MATAIAANLGAICWHGPHQVAAKSTTTSCFCGVLASSLSNSAFECTECTEPTPPLAFERERFPGLLAALAAGLGAVGGGADAASCGAARTLGGLPGNRSLRSTRSQDCVSPADAASEAPPRSVSSRELRCTCGPAIRSASVLKTHRRAATTQRLRVIVGRRSRSRAPRGWGSQTARFPPLRERLEPTEADTDH